MTMHLSLPSRRSPWLGRTLVASVLCACLTWTAAHANPKTGAPTELEKDHAARMARGLEIFKKDVRTLLIERCFPCHGGKKVESEFDLSDRERLLRGGLAGPAVVVGKAKESLLYKVVTHAREPHMPHQRKKLPGAAIAHLAAWIDHGAPYDRPLAGTEDAAAWTRTVVSAEARRFWSFQPLERVAPPRVANESWCRTAVDRFILAKLEAAGLTPNPGIDRRQLIRRAYFDMIGLPPSPDEFDAFVSDPSADAYDRLVDRLLGSAHFGERWARHWLDLARFGESHGFEHDYDRPNAYHYRDFVIKAFNDDLPYDQFVKWQLAGDEYAPHNNLALTATGFLAAGVHSTQITKNEVARHRYEELDDMSATTGTAMLGLTVGCARCHDHKFDPIPQSDYYRLLSTFTTTVRSEIDLDLDPAGYRKARAVFDREHAPYVAALEKFETEQLPARLARWEQSSAGLAERLPWVTLDLVSHKSQGGATFTKLEDGSLRAGGKNAPQDTYTLVADTELTGITAVRLEALADAGLVKGGPGRAANGNFALTDFRVRIVPRGSKAKAADVRLRNPRATFEQKGLPIAAAIDDDAKSAWAIDPQFGKDHAAVFDLESPLGSAEGMTLTFTLQFRNNTGHNLGRLRLSVSTLLSPVALPGDSIPEQALLVLRTPADKRTPEQRAALLNWYRTIDADWRKLNQQAQDHALRAPKPNVVKALIASEGLPPLRLHTQGEDFFPETHFLRRGDPDQRQGIAPQGFLQVLLNTPDGEKHWQAPPPSGWRTSYRRRALAEWITDVDEGAGHLLARVIVNRLWQHYLGRGMVATPSDFGTRGERPTHPELLDWLAGELVRTGWRLKPIHKLILTSAVYRQSSRYDEAKGQVDRDNRLCWRRPPRRLEAEAIRDALLAVSGLLDARMFGPGTLDESSLRRSIYFTVKRSKLLPMMQVFDAPDALGSLGKRPTTTIAPQALLLMNNAQVRKYAHGFARRLAPAAEISMAHAVHAGYRMALARLPSADELGDSASFVREQVESYSQAGKADAQELALADFCQVLMGLNEFVYID